MRLDPPSWFLLFFFGFLLVGPVSAGVVGGYFKPSVVSGYEYRWFYREWVDYCPACHHGGCLLVNPKGVPEGELTCGVCGADFCGVTGWDKGGFRWRLIAFGGGGGRVSSGVDLWALYCSF